MLLFLPPNSPFPIDLPRCKSQRWIVQPSTQQIREPKAQAKRLVYHIAWFNFFLSCHSREKLPLCRICIMNYYNWAYSCMHAYINRVSLWDEYTFLYQISKSMFWQRPKTKGVQIQCLTVKFPFSMEWG